MNWNNYILLVDDEEICHFIAKSVLSRMDTELALQFAFNGKDALELIESRFHQQQQLPHIILLDIQMPIINGFEFLEQLKTLTIPLDKIKVIMLSSSNEKKDIERAVQLGADGYLMKPLSEEKAEPYFR